MCPVKSIPWNKHWNWNLKEYEALQSTRKRHRRLVAETNRALIKSHWKEAWSHFHSGFWLIHIPPTFSTRLDERKEPGESKRDWRNPQRPAAGKNFGFCWVEGLFDKYWSWQESSKVVYKGLRLFKLYYFLAKTRAFINEHQKRTEPW
jgi:hypothetical protein